jgi:hypothetical protein
VPHRFWIGPLWYPNAHSSKHLFHFYLAILVLGFHRRSVNVSVQSNNVRMFVANWERPIGPRGCLLARSNGVGQVERFDLRQFDQKPAGCGSLLYRARLVIRCRTVRFCHFELEQRNFTTKRPDWLPISQRRALSSNPERNIRKMQSR